MDSRTRNTSRNIASGMINRAVAILFPFINRTAILWLLGVEFVGLSSLFASILQVLSISELGFNTAVVYCLYEPIANHDQKAINQLLSMLKKIYHIVGTVIIFIGLILLPFIRFLIRGNYPKSICLPYLFLLYLINSGISYYLFAYKETILIADQREDIANNIHTIVRIGVSIIQLAVLLMFRNYYLYYTVTICGTVISNALIARETQKRYPFLCDVPGKQEIPANIRKQVGGLLINRICDTFRNSFDSLIISSTIGLAATGIYGNYYYIYSALYGIMLVVCNSMRASVGNSIVKKTVDENFADMRKFSFLFAYILGVCAVCLLCLYQPFMRLWAGQELMLRESDMVLFCVYFYVINMNNIRNQYISGTGIWWHMKLFYILEAFGNLGLNVILGKLFGITGVITATIITIFLFNYLSRNHILFREYFGIDKKKAFYLEQLEYAAVTVAAAIFVYMLCNLLPDTGMLSLLIKGICSFVLAGTLMLGVFRLFPQYRYACATVSSVLSLIKMKSNMRR